MDCAMYAKSKGGFHTMPRDRARALSRRGSRTLTDLANDYAFTYAPYIQAAVRDVGHNYCLVAKSRRHPAARLRRPGAEKSLESSEIIGGGSSHQRTGLRPLVPCSTGKYREIRRFRA